MNGLLIVVLLGLLIGGVLGGLGGGGAILTVPALVYIIGLPAQEATTGSLLIVGLSSIVAAVVHQRNGNVQWRVGLAFGLTGIPAAWLGTWANARIDGATLLLGFSAVLVVAAVAMLAKTPDPSVEHKHSGSRPRAPLVVAAAALLVGLLTGFFGVGGGFVIVPALVLTLALPIHKAVGTSLLVIVINSAASLVSRAGTSHLDHFNWSVIVPFTLAAMVATLLGKAVADRLPAPQLQKAFAMLLILVAGYTAWQSVGGTPPAA